MKKTYINSAKLKVDNDCLFYPNWEQSRFRKEQPRLYFRRNGLSYSNLKPFLIDFLYNYMPDSLKRLIIIFPMLTIKKLKSEDKNKTIYLFTFKREEQKDIKIKIETQHCYYITTIEKVK